jgi:flavin-dependent dehydrogenase
MNQLSQPTRSTPFTTHYDVTVLGGGLCGISTALALADAGKKVIVVERRAMPGWEVTASFSVGFADSEQPITHRIHQQINAMGAMICDRVDPAHFEILIDRMLQQAGVDLLLFAQPTGLQVVDGQATAVIIGHRAGEDLIRADAFVDATEQGILWRQVGSATDLASGSQQTLFFNAVTTLPATAGVTLGGLGEIRIFRSVREGEVAVSYELPRYDDVTNRESHLEWIKAIRASVPELAEATVTHASFEPLPTGPMVRFAHVGVQHPEVGNLFGAAPWSTNRLLRTSAERSEHGETAAAVVVRTAAQRPASGGVAAGVTPEMTVTRCDVLVVGGGTAGSLAAVAAGREGASVVLLEASAILGGVVTGSAQYFSWHGIPGGLQDEYRTRCQNLKTVIAARYPTPMVHPEAAKIVLSQMCHEAGVTILHGVIGLGAQMQGNRITGVCASTPRGKILVEAAVVIDATGDGDIAVKAGAEAIPVGREMDGVIHCYTQSAQWLYPNYQIDSCNFDAGYCDPTDVVDLTRARREGVRQLGERFQIRMDEGSRMVYVCPLVGIRQGRQIVGDYVQRIDDQLLPTPFADCIGYSGAKYDCHSQDYENQQDMAVLWVWLLGNRERPMGGQIPYRMLLPKGVNGLLVACRAASADNEAHYQYRTIRNMMRTGEAAGIAAAICAREGILPRDIDVKRIQAKLVVSGALGPDVDPGPVVPTRQLDELRGMLASDKPKDAVWLLAMGGEDAHNLLRDWVVNGPEQSRFWAALALAWRRDPLALPELLRAVRDRMTQRTDYTPRSRNMVPLWQSCIVMLGRLGDRHAIPTLLDVLRDKSANLDVLIAVVRALGRIGDASVVPDLEQLLARGDRLPRERLFQQTNANARYPEREDALWQIELCLAEVLGQFGKPQAGIVRKHISDERLHVRRYAELVRQRTCL